MATRNIIRIFLGLTLFCLALPSFAVINFQNNPNRYINPFYVGFTGGYGATTWGHLVPASSGVAMSLSTPTNVSEGGATWGAFAGYEFLPQFALETSYMHYQAARLYFDPLSLFTYEYGGRTELTSRTESVTLMAKFMVFVPHTNVRAYSSVGAGAVHRYDAVKNIWRVNPSFGAGLNYDFTDHIMGEVGMNYIAGYGEAELDPTKDFVPFVYSAYFRLAYRF